MAEPAHLFLSVRVVLLDQPRQFVKLRHKPADHRDWNTVQRPGIVGVSKRRPAKMRDVKRLREAAEHCMQLSRETTDTEVAIWLAALAAKSSDAAALIEREPRAK
jgi:hypothetical protein